MRMTAASRLFRALLLVSTIVPTTVAFSPLETSPSSSSSSFATTTTRSILPTAARIAKTCPTKRTQTLLLAKKKKKKPAASSSGGGFGAVKAPKKPPTKQQVLKRVSKTYGGTTAQHIAQATQQRIAALRQAQPPAVQLALQIYQQVQPWEARQAQLTLLQQAQLDPADVAGAARARAELNRMYTDTEDENGLPAAGITSDADLHNLLQQFTWDASADAKAARELTGDMNAETSQRIERACAILAESCNQEQNDDDNAGLCLDIGCGFGVLVPFLKRAGIRPDKIHGVDLSAEMIRNAQEQHVGGPTFTACDFLNDYSGPTTKSSSTPFAAAVFCSCLHDFPGYQAAVTKAASLLATGGKLVIVHPQGASHVLQQARQNPVLVQRGLPSAAELQELCNDGQLKLAVEPASAGSRDEAKEGYLAVLEKV